MLRIRPFGNDTKVLTHEQTLDYFIKYHSGDMKARETLALRNQGLVYSTLLRYTFFNSLEDLISEGQIALLESIDTFDPKRGNTFATYAYGVIRRRMIKYINNNSHQFLSEYNKSLKFNLEEYINEQRTLHGNSPTYQDLSNYIRNKIKVHVSKDKVKHLLTLPRIVSLSEPVSQDSKREIEDITEDKSIKDAYYQIKTSEIKNIFLGYLEIISGEEKIILEERIIHDKDLRAIGKEYNIKEAKSKYAKALKAMRKYFLHFNHLNRVA